MTGEASRKESFQPDVDFFVKDTIDRFSRKTTTADGMPYVLHEAIIDSISESRRNPIDVASSLMQQTRLTPKEVGEEVNSVYYKETWTGLCMDISQSIISREIEDRRPDIYDKDAERQAE